MPITLHCPHCGMTAGVPDSAAGKSARCKGCGAIVAIPAATSAAPPPPAAPPHIPAEAAVDLAPPEAPAVIIEAPPPLEAPAGAARGKSRLPRDRIIIFGAGGLILILVLVATTLILFSRNAYSRYVQTTKPLVAQLRQIQQDLDRLSFQEFKSAVRLAQNQLDACEVELSPDQKEYASMQCLRSATDAYRQAADAWEQQVKASAAGDTAVATSQDAAVKNLCESASKAMNGAEFYFKRSE